MKLFFSKPCTCKILVLIWACLALPAFGQQLIFKNISEQVNLPSHECYNVIQDNRGYIWMTTENGLCRYNGSSLTIFDKTKGLPDNGIYHISEQANGAFRLISSGNAVVTMANGQVKAESYSKAIQKEMSVVGERAYLLTETQKGDIINTFKATFLADRLSGKIINLTKTTTYKKDLDLVVVIDGNKSHFIKNRYIASPQQAHGKFFLKLLALNGKNQKEIIVPFSDKTEIDGRIRIMEVNGTVFINLQKKLLAIRPDLTLETYEMPSKILSLYADKNNGLWVGLFQKGVYYFEDIRRMDNVKKSLEAYSVSGTLVDQEGGIWCTTLEKSVYYCNNVHAVSYANIPQLGKIATLLTPIGDEVFVSTAHDNLFAIRNGGIIAKPTDPQQNTDYTWIFPFGGKWYLSNKAFTTMANASFSGERVMSEHYNFPSSTYDNFEGKLYATSYARLFQVNNTKLEPLMDWDAEGIRALACVSRDAFYIGENNGLIKINPRTGEHFKISGISAAVTKLLKASDGRLWIATKGEGLQVMENQQLRRIRFPENRNIFLDIAEDAQGKIWASSENGLISIGSKKTGEPLRQYDLSNGLLSNDLGRIAINGKKLYVATVDGLCQLDTAHLVNKSAPKIYLSGLTVNKVPVDIRNAPFVFAHDRNSLALTFDVLTFKTPQHDLLLYRMQGRDSSWTRSPGNELQFDNLSPNDYKLVVYALNNDDYKSLTPVTIAFTIKKPFWLQWWFVLLCLATAFAVLYFSIKKVIGSVREKENEKNRIHTIIAQSQLSALQAQMNPHFIFNAISSIQNYILKNKEKEAYDYLAKFGKLIRMVLNNSRESTLPLFQELELLQTYVELEQLRFKDSFDFVLEVAENVNLYETYLPTMLIQPYIENAIWHGLMNLGDLRKGVLTLKISANSKQLQIAIEDNGIGRERANSFKKDTLHHSVGMKLTEQRLQTISKLKEYETIAVEITDLQSHMGEPLGTRVVLHLPLNI